MATTIKELEARLDALPAPVCECPEAADTGALEVKLDEVLVSVINALHALRLQSTHDMARSLEAKYFGGQDLQQVGDVVVTADQLRNSIAPE